SDRRRNGRRRDSRPPKPAHVHLAAPRRAPGLRAARPSLSRRVAQVGGAHTASGRHHRRRGRRAAGASAGASAGAARGGGASRAGGSPACRASAGRRVVPARDAGLAHRRRHQRRGRSGPRGLRRGRGEEPPYTLCPGRGADDDSLARAGAPLERVPRDVAEADERRELVPASARPARTRADVGARARRDRRAGGGRRRRGASRSGVALDPGRSGAALAPRRAVGQDGVRCARLRSISASYPMTDLQLDNSHALGRVVATERKPNTPHEFHFWTALDSPVGIGTIVRVDGAHPVNGQIPRIYGVVVEGFSYTDLQTPLHDVLGHDGTPDGASLAATERAEIRLYTAAVLRQLPEEPLQPVPMGRVYLAGAEDVAIALRMDGYLAEGARTAIPIGVYRAGGTDAPIYLDADFLLGPEAAHLNITGVSGLATKTSAIEWILQSIFTHFPAQKGSVAAVCFNVKGPDL